MANELKTGSLTSVNGYAPTFLSFAATSDGKYSPIRHTNHLQRSSFNQCTLPSDLGTCFSPCHEQDISSSAVPTFTGFPYVRQSFLFKGNKIEQS